MASDREALSVMYDREDFRCKMTWYGRGVFRLMGKILGVM